MDAATLCDAQIRSALKARLTKEQRRHAGAVLLDELGVCRGEVRVDVVLVNGLIHGFEIKSDRDSLRRLEVQVEFYGKVLDRATLVVGERHMDEAVAFLPEWWGVIRASSSRGGTRFSEVRRPRKNTTRNARALVELLWLDDALRLLAAHGHDRGVRGKPRRIVWDRVSETIDIDTIGAAVRANLKSRIARSSPP